jgi:hypothetical protein
MAKKGTGNNFQDVFSSSLRSLAERQRLHTAPASSEVEEPPIEPDRKSKLTVPDQIARVVDILRQEKKTLSQNEILLKLRRRGVLESLLEFFNSYDRAIFDSGVITTNFISRGHSKLLDDYVVPKMKTKDYQELSGRHVLSAVAIHFCKTKKPPSSTREVAEWALSHHFVGGTFSQLLDIFMTYEQDFIWSFFVEFKNPDVLAGLSETQRVDVRGKSLEYKVGFMCEGGGLTCAASHQHIQQEGSGVVSAGVC